MRIGILGIAIESSTFCPHRSRVDDFTVLTGQELLDLYDWAQPGHELAAAAEWVPVLRARALPGGALLAQEYARLKVDLLTRLRAAGQLDGVLLDLHGAMSVDGLVDAELDLVTAVREVVGPQAVLSAAMDLHGNVSEGFARVVDLLTCYRTAPHVDTWETRERAARNLVTAMREGTRPAKAWVPVPVLLPGEKTSTRIEPAAALYAAVPGIEARKGVLDAAVWVGYAWADEPRCHAAVVVTGYDAEAVRAGARELAEHYWRVRHEFAFVAPTGTLDQCVDAALASPARPFLISDSGDNPGAGGADDVAWTLGQLLARDLPSAVCASVTDADAVAALQAHAAGDDVSVTVGDAFGSGLGQVKLDGRLRFVSPAAAVITVGGLDAVITARRTAFHDPARFAEVGLDVTAYDIVVTKIGYLEPGLYAIAADWLLALTPGGVDQDLLRLGHHGIRRPMFPFDADMPDPDLEPRIL
ncbi:M81 family metallopeptidase [Actinomycetes bacterium KLBMP 9759]